MRRAPLPFQGQHHRALRLGNSRRQEVVFGQHRTPDARGNLPQQPQGGARRVSLQDNPRRGRHERVRAPHAHIVLPREQGRGQQNLGDIREAREGRLRRSGSGENSRRPLQGAEERRAREGILQEGAPPLRLHKELHRGQGRMGNPRQAHPRGHRFLLPRPAQNRQDNQRGQERDADEGRLQLLQGQGEVGYRNRNPQAHPLNRPEGQLVEEGDYDLL